jgi:hypothetical protein
MRRRKFVAASSVLAVPGCIGASDDGEEGMVTGYVPPDTSYAVSVGVEGADGRDSPIDIGIRLVQAGFSGVHQTVEDATLADYRDEFEDAHRRDDQQAVERISAEIRDEYSPDDAARFELSLTNTADETLEIVTGAPAPFGVLRAEAVGDDSGSPRLLWSDAYTESDHVSFYRRGLVPDDIGEITEMGAGETLTQAYEVAFPPGEYHVDGSIEVPRPDAEEDDKYSYTVFVEVTETEA